MTEEQRQRLSALQDGELDAASVGQLLAAAGSDPQLRVAWECYHLIGQTLRREPIDRAHRAIAGRVATALASEPMPLMRRAAQRPARQRYVGLALAASVALITVLSAPVLFEQFGRLGVLGGQAQQLAGAADDDDQRWQLDQPAVASKLDRFLVTHQAAAPLRDAKGMLQYATLVGYEGQR